MAVQSRWGLILLTWMSGAAAALSALATPGAGLALVALGDREDWGRLEVFHGRPVELLVASVGATVLFTAVAVVAGMKLSGRRKVRWGRVKVEAIEATAQMTKYPIYPTPRVGVHIKLYASQPADSEAIIPKHQVCMQVRLVAATDAQVCTGVSVRAPERPAAGETQPPNVYQDGEQVVIRGPGYLTVAGGLPAPLELENAPPDSIDVFLRFRPVGSRRSKRHELTLVRTQPEGFVPGPQYRAQWGWKPDTRRDPGPGAVSAGVPYHG
jgi:hypothetical protein